MSNVQTNVSFLNGVNGANVLRPAQNEIEDYLLYLETEPFSHMALTAQVNELKQIYLIYYFFSPWLKAM